MGTRGPKPHEPTDAEVQEVIRLHESLYAYKTIAVLACLTPKQIRDILASRGLQPRDGKESRAQLTELNRKTGRKRCSICHEIKPAGDFSADSRGYGAGLQCHCKKCSGERPRRYDYNRETWWEYRIIRKFGIDAGVYELMLDAQSGGCAICREPPPDDRKLCVDHCHSTGVVRGLLCPACNRALGWAEKKPVLMSPAMSEYISKSVA